MDVFEAVRTVLAVRSYQDRAVSAETVQRILEAGQLTGSSMNRQPWHFVVIEDPQRLAQLGSLAQSGPYLAQAPLAIAVVLDESQFAVSDGSRAIQSMMLTAWAEGVGSNWVGFLGFEDVKPLLGIPAQMDVLAILSFGYPAQPGGKGKKKRKTLSEIAHREHFGQPYSS